MTTTVRCTSLVFASTLFSIFFFDASMSNNHDNNRKKKKKKAKVKKMPFGGLNESSSVS